MERADLTAGALILGIARSVLSPDDPYRRFIEWLDENKGRWEEACRELGVEPPPEGPMLFNQLRAAVLSVFEADEQDSVI
jgi:hypothetical protein